MSELKPCPFCGGEAEKRYGHDIDNNISYAVICSVCHTGIFKANTGQNEWDAYGSMHEAIEAWNRRAKE